MKPARPDEVVETARRLIERRRLQERTGIIGESAAIQEVLVKIEQMAPVSSTVLVQGESGTGKELVAKALHDLSPRRGKPFITVNCAALPETLLESELFGHEKGAFTGAAERRLGRFELADTGTIFLDEIGEIPLVHPGEAAAGAGEPDLLPGGRRPADQGGRPGHRRHQPRRCAMRSHWASSGTTSTTGSTSSTSTCAPLRERREDIPLLVRRFIREFARTHDRTFRGITPEAMQRLVNAPWPGNVRQLRNLIESHGGAGARARRSGPATSRPTSWRGRGRSCRSARGGTAGRRDGRGRSWSSSCGAWWSCKLQVEELRRRLDDQPQRVQVIELADHATVADVLPEGDSDGDRPVVYRPGMTMAEVEKAAIEAALQEYRGNRRRAAEVLGIGERTLYRKIKAYQLE